MPGHFLRRFKNTYDTVNSDELQKYAHLENPTSFTRRRAMPLSDIVLCALSKKGLTTAMELRQYFKQKGCEAMSISKQGYLQQRKKLNPEVFSYLNREYLQDFYASKEPVLWHGHLVFAIDGSKAEIPNSKENRKSFGTSGNHHTDGQARVLLSGMSDVFNDFFLDIQLGALTESEIKLAKQNIHAAKTITNSLPMLVIFDRGYPSLEFVDFLEENHIQYLFRLSSNDYKKERGTMSENDEIVELKHTAARIAKIKTKDADAAIRLSVKRSTKTRMLAFELPSGQELTLMTSLPPEYSSVELQNLYFKRWEIEKKYHTLKNKMKFESVTGKASIYVHQDFWAQLFVYNMIQDVRHAADEGLQKKARMKNYKNPVHVNENMAVGLFKESFIKILIEPDARLRGEKLLQLQESIENYILPVRQCKSHERKRNITNKYKNNQKNSF